MENKGYPRQIAERVRNFNKRDGLRFGFTRDRADDGRREDNEGDKRGACQLHAKGRQGFVRREILGMVSEVLQIGIHWCGSERVLRLNEVLGGGTAARHMRDLKEGWEPHHRFFIFVNTFNCSAGKVPIVVWIPMNRDQFDSRAVACVIPIGRPETRPKEEFRGLMVYGKGIR